MKAERGTSLVLVVTVYTALVVAGGMAAYALYQYIATPDSTILGLMLEHGWHVVALGVATYLALNVVLYRQVIHPIQELNVKLYAISKGDFSPVTVASKVKEIQGITGVVTFLLAQIGKSADGMSISQLSQCSHQIRSLAKESDALEEPAKEAFMEIANDIDKVSQELSVSSLQQEDQ